MRRTALKKQYDIPVVSAKDVFEVASSLGIVPWKEIGKPTPLEEYLKKDLSPDEKKDLRFAPKTEVAFFKTNKNRIFRGFRNIGPDGVVIFSLLPSDLVVVCAEFRHGSGEVMLNLPGGLVESGEHPEARARKEFEEETGIVLSDVVPLSNTGTALFARQMKTRNFSFLGIPKNPIEVCKQNLDIDERLAVLLIPLGEWFKLIQMEKVEGYSVTTTMMASMKLGKVAP